jgi:hypothetical protein
MMQGRLYKQLLRQQGSHWLGGWALFSQIPSSTSVSFRTSVSHTSSVLKLLLLLIFKVIFDFILFILKNIIYFCYNSFYH